MAVIGRNWAITQHWQGLFCSTVPWQQGEGVGSSLLHKYKLVRTGWRHSGRAGPCRVSLGRGGKGREARWQAWAQALSRIRWKLKEIRRTDLQKYCEVWFHGLNTASCECRYHEQERGSLSSHDLCTGRHRCVLKLEQLAQKS